MTDNAVESSNIPLDISNFQSQEENDENLIDNSENVDKEEGKTQSDQPECSATVVGIIEVHIESRLDEPTTNVEPSEVLEGTIVPQPSDNTEEVSVIPQDIFTHAMVMVIGVIWNMASLFTVYAGRSL